MNSKNSERSDSHRLLIKHTDKIYLKRRDKFVALKNLSIYYTWKNIKKSYKNDQLVIQKWPIKNFSFDMKWQVWIKLCIIFYIRHLIFLSVFNILSTFNIFGQLLDISPQNYIFLKTVDSEFVYIEVWFTDWNSKMLEIEDEINIILVIN